MWGDFMQIYLYVVSDDPDTMPKTLSDPVTVAGSVRDPSVDLMRPVITLTGTPAGTYNYAYIPDFNRYYFVDPPVTERTGLVMLPMRIDVLQTYHDQIMSAPVILERSTDVFNADIADPRRQFYQDRQNQYITIGDVGAPASIVMVTVG